MAHNDKWGPDTHPTFVPAGTPASQYRQHQQPQFAPRPYNRPPAHRKYAYVDKDDPGPSSYSWRPAPAPTAAGPSHARAVDDDDRRGRSPTPRTDRLSYGAGQAPSPPARQSRYPPGSGWIEYLVPGMPQHRSRSPAETSFQYVCRLSLPEGYLIPILRGSSDSRRDELRKNGGLAFLRFDVSNEDGPFAELIGSLRAIEHCSRAIRTTLSKDVESGRVNGLKLDGYRWTRTENARLMPLLMNRDAFHNRYHVDSKFWLPMFARFEQDERAKVAARTDVEVAPPQPEQNLAPPAPVTNTNATPIGPRVVHPPSLPPPPADEAPNPSSTTRALVKFTLAAAPPTRNAPPSLQFEQPQASTQPVNQQSPQHAVVQPQPAPQPETAPRRHFPPAQHTSTFRQHPLQLRQPLPARPVQPTRAEDRYDRHARENPGQPFANYRPRPHSRSNSPSRAPLMSRIEPPPLTVRVGERASSAPLEHRPSHELPPRPSRHIVFMEPEAYDRIIPYPPECTAAVIGSKGSVILEMQETTGVRCRVVKFNDPGLFCVSGTDLEIQRAARMLEDVVQSKPHVRGWRVGDTPWKGLGDGTDRTLTGWKKYASTEHRARSRSRSRSPIAGPDSEHHEARESHYVPRSPRRRPSRRSSSRSSSRTRSRSRSGSPSGSHSPYHTRRRTHSPESHSLSPDASLDIRESFSPAPISTDQEPYTSGTDPEPLSPANDDDHSSPVPTAPMVTDEHRAALRLLRSLPVTLRIKEWGSDPLVESSDEDEQIDYDEGPLPAVDRQPRKEVEERGQRACIVAYYVGPDDSEDKVNSIVKALVGAGKRGRPIVFKDDVDEARSVVKRQRVAS